MNEPRVLLRITREAADVMTIAGMTSDPEGFDPSVAVFNPDGTVSIPLTLNTVMTIALVAGVDVTDVEEVSAWIIAADQEVSA